MSLADMLNGLTPDQMASVPASQQQPFSLNAWGGALDAGGAIMGGVSHIMFGLQSQQAAQYQAAQLRQNAGQVQASAQRQAFALDQQTQFTTSRALAIAAGSGGGASDPTVVSLIARDAAQGAYLKQVALYEGADRARLLNEQADAKEFEGRNQLNNSLEVGAAQFLGGATNLLKTQSRGASLYQRFAGAGPNVAPVGDGSGGW